MLISKKAPLSLTLLKQLRTTVFPGTFVDFTYLICYPLIFKGRILISIGAFVSRIIASVLSMSQFIPYQFIFNAPFCFMITEGLHKPIAFGNFFVRN